jgi:glycogen operon protein
MSSARPIEPGHPDPLGASFDGGGVNFAVFSEHATKIEVCLFSADGQRETSRIALRERTGHTWHGRIAGLLPGQMYGLRAHGPFRPEEGHRFNPHKLLIDPYARRLTGHPRWSDALLAYNSGTKAADLTFSTRDSARFMPRCVVEDIAPLPTPARAQTPLSETVIYEAHVKGLTAQLSGVPNPGTFLGLASDKVLDHLTRLGVTAVELLPVQAFLNDRFLVQKGLTNYWGYQTLGFFAPDPRYLSGTRIAEFQHMVARLHAAGIEVILDVVYNHTGEGSELGPTLSFRGLDNASYYMLAPERRHYINDTGCGNTLNLDHPMVLRMVMDSLRYWAGVMGVDGFRFDLAATLARRAQGFDTHAPFLAAIRQDPMLSRLKLIAEPWDIGPGGYQLGAFGHPFLEWNDKFRDTVRQFWRGDACQVPDLATRITGSAAQFDHGKRAATSSVNLITAHDGFTLMDLVSYTARHNEANGEENRDGHDANFSDNFGVEGPTDDATITAARDLRRRNLMATLLLSQGTPMLLAGDEAGNSQQGNNNAYCQDNATGWVNWAEQGGAMSDFTARLIAFRKAHPILGQKLFLHSRERSLDGIEDVLWWHASGRAMAPEDWQDPELRHLVVELRTAAGTPLEATLEHAICLVFNAGDALSVALPPTPKGKAWSRKIDSAAPGTDSRPEVGPMLAVAAQCVVTLVLENRE